MLGTSLAIEVRQLSQRPDHHWYKARAGAESVKTLAWKYAVGGEPFGINQSVVDDDFLGQVESVMRSLRDVDWLPATGDSEQITPAMETLRSAPLGQRRAAYERGRVEEELVWYRGKAIDNDRQARRWSARSAWVAREVSYWRQHKPIDHLLVVLTGGEVVWDDALGDFDWDKTTVTGPRLLVHPL